jgi:hypothetical protein
MGVYFWSAAVIALAFSPRSLTAICTIKHREFVTVAAEGMASHEANRKQRRKTWLTMKMPIVADLPFDS